MAIILFLMDTSGSMNQRTCLGPTYLDYGKIAIENFLKVSLHSLIPLKPRIFQHASPEPHPKPLTIPLFRFVRRITTTGKIVSCWSPVKIFPEPLRYRAVHQFDGQVQYGKVLGVPAQPSQPFVSFIFRSILC